MAVVGSLVVLLGTNNTALTAGLLKAEGQLKGFGATAGTTGAMAGAALAGIGLVAVAGLGMAVMAAKSFQEEMAKVNTIAHLAPEPLAQLGQEVRNLSVATGVGVGDLTSGLYDLFSVGVPAGQAMEFLTNATTLSIGGLSTANEAVNAITTAINSWSTATGAAKLTMADSARVVDIFAQAIAAGGMTAADIPGALANVAAQAAMMNMPLQEVAATWAILTVRGLSASEASTSLAATLTALAKAPPGMEKLQKATGKTYLQIAKTQGVHEAVMQVVADAQKFGVVLEDVFGRKEALPFVTFTTGAGGDALWGTALAGEVNSAGVAVGQMNERTGTLDNQLRILGASVNELGIGLGTALLPPLTTVVQMVSGAVQGVAAWAAANPALSSSLLPVIAGVAALGLGVAVLGAPFVAILAVIALVALNMDNLARGIQRVIDTIQRMIDLAIIGAQTVQAIPGAVVDTARGGNVGHDPIGDWIFGTPPPPTGEVFLPPRPPVGPGGGEVFLPPRPGATPITNHITVEVGGDRLTEWFERKLYNDQTVYNSGFSSDERPRH